MSILCGIDFSETSAAASTVASQLAAKLGQPLHLVHAVDAPGEGLDPALTRGVSAAAQTQLELLAKELRHSCPSVECHIRSGLPDEVVLQLAKELSAKLLIVGASGRRRSSEWPLGSHADRTAERTHVPTLIVRDAKPFAEWLAGSRALRIVLGIDASQSSETAAQWVLELTRLGSCEVVLTHLYWPPEELHRLGLGGLRGWGDPDVAQVLREEFVRRFPELFEAARVSYRIEPHVGRIGDALAAFAAEDKADLIVVGCHDRKPLERFWQGSVSRHALRCAPMSVACIPAPVDAVRSRSSRTVGSVLVATDFSKIGNAAIPLAYSVVGFGGAVHLLHVVESGRSPLDAYDVFSPSTNIDPALLQKLRAQLTSHIPKDWSGTAAITHLHVLEARDAKTAICQAAERLGVDLICLGTHGRHGLGRAVLGSVAASVLEQSHRPVLLTRGPLE